MFAKMDVWTGVESGTYWLVRRLSGKFAKMDACAVKITVLSRPSAHHEATGGGLQREDVMGSDEPP